VGSLNSWMESFLALVLEYISIFHLLSRGWIIFIFHTKEDVASILIGRWYWDQHLLCIKP